MSDVMTGSVCATYLAAWMGLNGDRGALRWLGDDGTVGVAALGLYYAHMDTGLLLLRRRSSG